LAEAGVYHRQGIWTMPGRFYTCRSDKFKSMDVYHTRIFENRSFFRYSWRNLVSAASSNGQVIPKFDAPGPPRELLAEGGAPAWRIYYQNVAGHEIPRAYLTGHLTMVKGDHFAAMRQIDPYVTSVLDTADTANQGAEQDEGLRTLAATPDRAADSRAAFDRENRDLRVVQYTPNKAVFDLEVRDGTRLFNYSDGYEKGWRCLVDGAESRVWCVNHMFKAAVLKPGHHRVEFRYESPSFHSGLRLSLTAACLLSGLGATGLVGGRRGWLVGLAVIALAVPAGLRVHQQVNRMAYRDAIINYDPTAPRLPAPDLDEYLGVQSRSQS
jgi:hypothetical protein